MPWRDSVEGVLVMFLGGQQTGDAWADIVFGDQVPTGRLPVMMPEAEEDSIPPGTEPDVVYSEGLATSYRNPGFRAAYAFGHGLTYTTVEYQNASSSLCGNTGECEVRIRVSVKNTGGRAAPTVAQLYLQFPASAGNSVPVLKGFKKTSEISPGSSQEVVFELTQRDLSYYSAERGGGLDQSHLRLHCSHRGVLCRHSRDCDLLPGTRQRAWLDENPPPWLGDRRHRGCARAPLWRFLLVPRLLCQAEGQGE
mmetsp:Transcript_142425/g.455215  ORF Transcript_142425/g.455215 Transcript_142425/m.455215 type:complete len:252 (+) Transcript_142425:1947-2702(+)